MKIVIGCDHTACKLKTMLAAHISGKGHKVIDLGVNDGEACDFPDKGREVAAMVVSGGVDLGVLICGTGVGVSIAANKVPGARAACVSEPLSAMYTRLHNDANILAMGARIVSPETARRIVDAFLDTGYTGEQRHVRRVAKIAGMENAPGECK